MNGFSRELESGAGAGPFMKDGHGDGREGARLAVRPFIRNDSWRLQDAGQGKDADFAWVHDAWLIF